MALTQKIVNISKKSNININIYNPSIERNIGVKFGATASEIINFKIQSILINRKTFIT